MLTPQEANGLVDERGQLTPEAKDRIAKMLVGRLYDSPAEIQATPPELRNKLERVAPQVLRVEGRPDWSLTGPTREAVSILADARAHGVKNLGDLARQTDLNGKAREYSPEALAIARAMQNGQVALERAFRMYANDEALSRNGGQGAFFDPPARQEAFDAAFGEGATAKYRPSFEPTRETESDQEYWPQARAAVDTDAKGEQHLYVNGPARKLLRAVMRAASPEQVPEGFAGTTLPVGRAERVLQLLDENARTGQPEARPAFRHLAEQLREALRRTPEGVSVVNADARVPEATVSATEGEEAFHRATLRATGGRDIPESEARRYLHSTTPIYRAAERLRELQPHLDTDGQVVEEMAAILQGGEWAKLGLSDSQANEAWHRFGKLMSDRYGEQGREVLKYGHESHAGARERIEQGAGRPDGGDAAPLGGEDEGTGPRYRFAVRRDSLRGPGGVQPPVAGTHGSAGEAKGSGSGQPGLFDSAAERQSQVDAQRDSDKLLGERLTAQFKSGLAAKPSKLKPVENRGLFEEARPETGNLFSNFFGDESGTQRPPEDWSTEDLKRLVTVGAHYLRHSGR